MLVGQSTVTTMNVQPPTPLNPVTFGEAVHDQRIRARLGLRETARKAGISPGHLSDIEHGRRQPSFEVTGQIMTAISEAYCHE